MKLGKVVVASLAVLGLIPLQKASAQLEKPARLRTLRRDIARVETRMSQVRAKAA